MQQDEIDIHDPDLYVEGVPHHLFRALRARSPVLEAEHEEQRVDEVGFAGLLVQLAVAGNETTRTLLAGAFLAGPPRRVRSNLNNAYKAIPVRLVPR